MRDHPIIFTAESVRAILAGRKTQTRRVVGLPEFRPSTTPGYVWTWRGRAPVRSEAQQRRHAGGCWQDVQHDRLLQLCPYGAPGDRLWVRETYAPADRFYQNHDCDPPHVVAYRADRPAFDTAQWDWDALRWRSPRCMPRALSRLTLEVVAVRVERVRAISEDDARAEGVVGVEATDAYHWEKRWPSPPLEYRPVFLAAWDAVNGRRKGCAWAANPWVWALTFRRVEGGR